MINARFILRAGDFVLVKGHKKPGLVFKTNAHGTIAVRFANNTERWFCSRKGYADILAACRPDGQGFKPL
jgi:hypothetical protein